MSMATRDERPATTDTSEFARRRWPAVPEAAALARADVLRWLAPFDTTEGCRQDLTLAVSEAVANSVVHAYSPDAPGSVGLTFWTDDRKVWFAIVDEGSWHAPEISDDRPCLGITFMRRLADAVVISYGARGTTVLLCHTLPRRRDRRPAVRSGA
ncbi:MAG TPA: ATP-binding protein [Pseudonocardia sp.]|jgi:anti-sigma regulatory factor (Ser/Thr protein kinase)